MLYIDENNKDIQDVLKQVIEVAKPKFVFLYNCKHELDGDLRSFKLCIICEFDDKRSLLRDIFDVDCDIPFDVLLYTGEQFAKLRDDESAFANEICRRGKMIYGQK